MLTSYREIEKTISLTTRKNFTVTFCLRHITHHVEFFVELKFLELSKTPFFK